MRYARRWICTALLAAPTCLPAPASAQDASQDDHLIRALAGVGTPGYNLGLEGEYAVLPYVSILGALQSWFDPLKVSCLGVCAATDEGWGLGMGIRLSSDWELPWGFFVQTDAGFFSFSGGRTGALASLGGRGGVFWRAASWIEVDLGLKYQRVEGQVSGDVSYPVEHWGALVLGLATPVG